MPELESLRGIASLAVLFLHGLAWQYSGRLHFSRISEVVLKLSQPGWLGVNLFFVLSGFLITGILLDSKPEAQYYKRFYIRRALRILPACYALLLLLLILGQASLSFVVVGMFYMANLTSFLGVGMAYGPLWSLAVEEHFYFIWPVVVRNLTVRHLLAASGGLFAVTAMARGLAFYFGHPQGIDWYTWFVCDGLAAGSVLAIVLRSQISRKHVWILAGTLLLGTMLLAALTSPFGVLTRQRLLGAAFQFTLIHTFFAGIILLFLLVGTSRLAGWVSNPVLKFFGYISYGLYLVHFMVFRIYDHLCARYFPQLQPADWRFDLVLLRLVVGGGAAIGLAYLSRKYYEEIFLRMKDRLAPSPKASKAHRTFTQPAVAATAND